MTRTLDEIPEGSIDARCHFDPNPQASVDDEGKLDNLDAFGVPVWASQQIETGLKRMIRIHLIK